MFRGMNVTWWSKQWHPVAILTQGLSVFWISSSHCYSFLGFTWVFGCFSSFFPHGTSDTIDVFFAAEWHNRFNAQSSIPRERKIITFSSMARVINVNLYKLCLLKKLAAKIFWSTRCARLVWQGQIEDIHAVFQKIKRFGLLYVIMSASGEKTSPTTQNPTKPHSPSPQSPHSSKKHPTTQTVQDQNGAYIKDKKEFNELWFIRKYKISDSSWEQSKSQKQLTLIKLARRCKSGMHYLVLTCIPWNHIFINFDFWGASVAVWSPETKLVCNFCHQLNQLSGLFTCLLIDLEIMK